MPGMPPPFMPFCRIGSRSGSGKRRQRYFLSWFGRRLDECAMDGCGTVDSGMDFDEHAPSSPRAGSCPCRRGHRRGRRRPWSPVGVDRVEVEEVSDDRGGDRELRLFLRSSMGARRTLGRTVGESAVEVSSSRSGRVSSSSSILGPILACSVPSLSGKGGAIVAAKKYRPARSNSSQQAHVRSKN